MDLQEFTDFLDEYGIQYYESGVSLCLKECPACGSSQFKVLLRVHGLDDDHEPFFGRCQRGSCEEGYSSIKYLIKMGIPRDEVLDLHGLDPIAALEGMADPNSKKKREPDILSESLEPTPKYVEQVISLSEFYDIGAWSNHPASKYAVSRGITPEFYKDVMIDADFNAVVFVCRNKDGLPIGYQKRFVAPTNPKMKTQTMSGFVKTENLLEYPNSGDILVCEGPFTAVSAWHFGFHAICTFGASVSQKQIDKIIQISENTKKKIGVAAENDKAGLKAYKAVRAFLYWKKIDIFRVYPEEGKDLNDTWQAQKGFRVETNDNWQGPAIPDVNFFEQ